MGRRASDWKREISSMFRSLDPEQEETEADKRTQTQRTMVFSDRDVITWRGGAGPGWAGLI